VENNRAKASVDPYGNVVLMLSAEAASLIRFLIGKVSFGSDESIVKTAIAVLSELELCMDQADYKMTFNVDAGSIKLEECS